MSLIKIYKTILTPDRNAKLDQITNYLNKCEVSFESDHLQYQKVALDMTIKIPFPQEKRFELGNYVRITQDNRLWYFFIMGSEWTSKKTVKLFLSMDTVNTFYDISFSDRTQIFREHKDRFIKSFDGKTLWRTIWPLSEDISVPLYNDGQNITLQPKDANFADTDWFLMYKTRDDLTPDNLSNPIECDLFADAPLTIKKAATTQPEQTLTPAMMTNEYYFFDPINNPGGSFSYTTETSGGSITAQDKYIYRIHKTSADGAVIEQLYYEKTGDYYAYDSSIVVNNQKVVKMTFKKSKCLIVSGKINGWREITESQHKFIIETGAQPALYTLPINYIDRTDSRIMKIIRLPYCPVPVEKVNGEVKFPAKWEFKNQMMRLKPENLGDEFHNKNVAQYSLNEYVVVNNAISPEHQANPYLESKLYHSDYYSVKLVYDSFAKEIALENFGMDGISRQDSSYVPKMNIDFKMTNTINSKMCFHYWIESYDPQYRLNSLHDIDYDYYLLVGRNNEETIFSNDYVNYIRNGLHYDQKQQNLSMWQQGLNMAIQAGSAVISHKTGKYLSGAKTIAGLNKESMDALEVEKDFLNTYGVGDDDYTKKLTDINARMAGYLKENRQAKAIPLAQTISTATSAIQSGLNMIFSQLQFENQMAKKKAMLGAQATATAGSDDMDLMRYYNNNKLQIIKYQPRDEDKKMLFKLFYLYGYKTNEIKAPNINSRYWFNYIQCDAHFQNEESSLYADFITDLKTRYQQGITIFHVHNGQYDLDQYKENLETSLI